MEYALDQVRGKILSASEASQNGVYTCPRPGCGGRVYFASGVIQRPHFRHCPGEGTAACDEYLPDQGAPADDQAVTDVAAVEDDEQKLGISLTQLDGVWGLGLRLPCIPHAELGDAPLVDLLQAYIDIFSGTIKQRSVSAIELKPGDRTVTVDVGLSSNPYRTSASGKWPSNVKTARWTQDCRGLNRQGTLFRQRLGEWARLGEGTGVRACESLMLLADQSSFIPETLETNFSGRIFDAHTKWIVNEIRLPPTISPAIEKWLDDLGHRLLPRQWDISAITPPRAYSETGHHTYWVTDRALFRIDPPGPSNSTTIVFEYGSNASIINVPANPDSYSVACFVNKTVGTSRVSIASDRSIAAVLNFVDRPSPTFVCQQLNQNPRLRVSIGSLELVAWKRESFELANGLYDSSTVKVDLGYESVRAQLKFWILGRLYTRQGLSSNEVARTLIEVLETASRIEIDAQNLGSIAINLKRVAELGQSQAHQIDRLTWYQEVMTSSSVSPERRTPALIGLPKSLDCRRTKFVESSALVRARIAQRLRGRSRRDKQ